MTELTSLGKMLLLMGGLIALLGLMLLLVGKVPFLGRLPGDIMLWRGNVSCFVPIATSILLSLLLTLLLNLIARLLSR
jgi:hypothetical protein